MFYRFPAVNFSLSGVNWTVSEFATGGDWTEVLMERCGQDDLDTIVLVLVYYLITQYYYY